MNGGLSAELAKADRLTTLTQRIGYALWQLQALESTAASYFVLLAQATRGMGKEAGEALVVQAMSKPFGHTLANLKAKGLLDKGLADRFDKLKEERNWLAHRSRFDCRAAVATGAGLAKMLERIETIADEAGALNKEVDVLIGQFVAENGITKEQVEKDAARLLAQWEAGEA